MFVKNIKFRGILPHISSLMYTVLMYIVQMCIIDTELFATVVKTSFAQISRIKHAVTTITQIYH
jgi:hypothetical protein